MLSVVAVCINENDELSRTALMSMTAYLRDLVSMVFSCFVLRVLKKFSATRGDTDCKEVFGVKNKKTRAGGKLKESDYTPAEALGRVYILSVLAGCAC